MRRWVIAVLMLLAATVARAQVDDMVEQWLGEEANPEAAAELGDLIMQLQASPANLNDTASLSSVPFLTPFHIRALGNYIRLHGPLLTLKELAFVPGFDSQTLALVAPLVTVAQPEARGWARWWQGRHTVVAAVGGTVEQAQGYADSTYPGDNLRALLCYTYRYRDHIDLRLVADKDPAEAWGRGNYCGYHLMVGGVGRLERLIVGRYNLQFGQGLTLWTGLSPFNLVGSPPVRFGAGVRPAAAFYEEGYQQGVAATVGLGRGWHLSGFGSAVGGERLCGGHLGLRRGNLIAGFTVAYTALADSLQRRDYVYNQNRFRGDRLLNLGLDAAWQRGRWLLYAEAALADSASLAATAGVQLQVDSRNTVGLACRAISPRYHNLHAQPYSLGTLRGEQALTLDARLALPAEVEARLSADLYRLPALTSGAYHPSSGEWVRLQLSRRVLGRTELRLRYAFRRKERNIPNLDSTLYLAEQTLRRQWQAELRHEAGRWLLTTRAVYARFGSQHADPQRGWALMQTARYTAPRLQATASAAWFDVSGYYARLYLSESNLQYAWSLPMLNGRGLRASLVVRCPLGSHFTAAAKVALTCYPGQETVGTGAAQTEGPLRRTWMLQLRRTF